MKLGTTLILLVALALTRASSDKKKSTTRSHEHGETDGEEEYEAEDTEDAFNDAGGLAFLLGLTKRNTFGEKGGTEQGNADNDASTIAKAKTIVAKAMGKSEFSNGRTFLEYGYVTGLFVDGGEQFCGGALIAPNWVVTTASCLNGKSNVFAVVGLQYRHLTNYETYGFQVLAVRNITIHEGYREGTYNNDIALLELSTNVKTDDKLITPIRLPKISQENLDFTGTEAKTLGFGRDESDSSKISPFLREGTSVIMSKTYCQIPYLLSTIYDTNICLSGVSVKGFCKGDEGGPLIYYEKDGKPTLIGVNSYVGGLGCSLTWPMVFTKISSYLRWIHSVTKIPAEL